MSRVAFLGLGALCVAASCGVDATLPTQPAPPIHRDSVAPVPGFVGSALNGKWVVPSGDGFTKLTIDVTEKANGQLEGSWSANLGLTCGCALTGRVSPEGAAIVAAAGSARSGSDVTLFLTVGSGLFVVRSPWGSFVGHTVDETHISGTLFFSDGTGYFGDDGVSQTVVISR